MITAQPAPDGFSVGRRQLYMLPTRHGFYFAVVALAMLLAAVNYNNGLAYGFCFLLFATVLISMLYTHRNLEGVIIRAAHGDAVFAGEPVRFPLMIENSGDRPRLAVWLDHDESPAPFNLDPGDSTCRFLTVENGRRGISHCPPICLASHYPFGLLFTWTRKHRPDTRCIVYPAPASPTPIPRGLDNEKHEQAGLRVEGDDFIGLKEFAEGDSPKHVHWPLAARGQGLFTKQFGGETGATVWLDFNATTGADVEARLSQMCRWLLDAENQGYKYGLRLPALAIQPGFGAEHQCRCLTALALA